MYVKMTNLSIHPFVIYNYLLCKTISPKCSAPWRPAGPRSPGSSPGYLASCSPYLYSCFSSLVAAKSSGARPRPLAA